MKKSTKGRKVSTAIPKNFGFELKQPVILLTNLRLKKPVLLLTDLKHLPQSIVLEDSPGIRIRNDLGKACTDVDEDEINRTNQHDDFAEASFTEQNSECFDENDESENESGNLLTKPHESLLCNLRYDAIIDSNDLVFMCTICNTRFMREELLEKHLIAHEEGYLLYTCTKCQISFNNEFALKCHNVTKHPKRKWKKSKFIKTRTTFMCSVCEVSYDKKKHLLKHIMESHKPPRRLAFPCDKCEMSFSKKCCLKKHLKRHKREPKYVCTFCSCSFRDRNSFNDHILLHTGKKPFKCDTCGKGFRLFEILKKHLLKHVSYRPYKCSECQKSYIRKGNLIEHVQQIVCSKCQKVFYCKTMSDKHTCYENGETRA